MEVKVSANTKLKKKKINGKLLDLLYKVITVIIIIAIWQFSAEKIGSSLLLPMPMDVFKGFITCITDPEIVKNVLITLQRVLKGFMYAMLFGLPLGLIMGFSSSCE